MDDNDLSIQLLITDRHKQSYNFKKNRPDIEHK